MVNIPLLRETLFVLLIRVPHLAVALLTVVVLLKIHSALSFHSLHRPLKGLTQRMAMNVSITLAVIVTAQVIQVATMAEQMALTKIQMVWLM
ncbi:hypothetical protein VO69_21485 [Aeromonas salmonicida]|nr:hypothetical protein VO69_21485 [Aeromonas salmonicida]